MFVVVALNREENGERKAGSLLWASADCSSLWRQLVHVERALQKVSKISLMGHTRYRDCEFLGSVELRPSSCQKKKKKTIKTQIVKQSILSNCFDFYNVLFILFIWLFLLSCFVLLHSIKNRSHLSGLVFLFRTQAARQNCSIIS